MNFSSKNVNKMNEIERQTIISNNMMVPKENSEERRIQTDVTSMER